MEWLSTGEMINRLKVGEVAESSCADMIKVKKDPDQAIRFDDGTGQCLPLNELNMTIEWRILPNYVSFGEAMEALKEGKFIQFHSKKIQV